MRKINPPFGDGLYNPFMVVLGMVYNSIYHINYIVLILWEGSEGVQLYSIASIAVEKGWLVWVESRRLTYDNILT